MSLYIHGDNLTLLTFPMHTGHLCFTCMLSMPFIHVSKVSFPFTSLLNLWLVLMTMQAGVVIHFLRGGESGGFLSI